MFKQKRGIVLRGTIVSLLISSFTAFAQQGPSDLNVAGTLYLPSGVPVTQSSVSFKLDVYDKASTCLLYSERHLNEDLSQTKGLFALTLGRGTSAANYLEGSATLTAKVFQNSGAVAGGWAGCAAGVNLAVGDERVIRVSYDLGGGLVAMSPDVPISSSAYAMVAETLQGKHASDLVQVRDDSSVVLNQTNIETIFTTGNYARLLQLLNPTAAVGFGGQRLSNIAAPSAASDAANKGYTDANLGGKTIDLVDVGTGTGGGKVLTWDAGQSKWVAMTATATDITKLPLLGGTMAGSIAMGGFDITGLGNLKMNTQKVFALGTFTDAQETAMITGLSAANAGTTWYNTTSSSAKYWNGTAAVASSFVGAAAGGSLTGTYPNPGIANNAIATVNVANNAITSAKLNATGIAINRIILTDGTTGAGLVYKDCAANEILKFSVATGWDCATVASLSPVTSVAGKTGAVTLNAGDISGLGTAALKDQGAAAGNVPLLDSGAKLLTSTIPGFGGDVTGTITATVVARIQGSPVSATAPGMNQVLMWNGTAWAPTAIPSSQWVTTGSDIYYTTGRVGVGTTAPGAGFHVVSANGSRFQSTGTLGVGVAGAADVSLGQGSMASGNNTWLSFGRTADTSGSGWIQVYKSGSSIMQPLLLNPSGGNVGVGVSTPARVLDVAGPMHIAPAALPGSPAAGDLAFDSAASNALKFYNGSAWQTVGTGSGAGDFKADGSVPMTAALQNAAGTTALPGMTFVGDTDTGVSAPAADNVAISTGGVERVRVASSGFVGIGTSSPVANLDVNGTLRADYIQEGIGYWDAAPLGTSTVTGGSLTSGGPQNRGMPTHWTAAAGNQLVLNLGTAYSNVAAVGFGTQWRTDYHYTPNGVTTEVSSNCSTYTTVGTETGNTTKLSFFYTFTPQSVRCVRLTITAIQPGYAANISSLRVLSTVNSGGNLNPWASNGAYDIFLATTGNVGIGTKSPNRLLDVAGPVHFTPAALPGSPVAGDLAFDSAASNALKFYNGSAWQTVGTGSGAGDFKADGSVAMTAGLRYFAGTTALPGLTPVGDTDTGISAPAADVFAVSTAGSERLRVGATGNLGLGTTAPSTALSFNGNSAQTIGMERNTNAGGPGQFLALSSGGAATGSTDQAGGDLFLKTGFASGTGGAGFAGAGGLTGLGATRGGRA